MHRLSGTQFLSYLLSPQCCSAGPGSAGGEGGKLGQTAGGGQRTIWGISHFASSKRGKTSQNQAQRPLLREAKFRKLVGGRWLGEGLTIFGGGVGGRRKLMIQLTNRGHSPSDPNPNQCQHCSGGDIPARPPCTVDVLGDLGRGVVPEVPRGQTPQEQEEQLDQVIQYCGRLRVETLVYICL